MHRRGFSTFHRGSAASQRVAGPLSVRESGLGVRIGLGVGVGLGGGVGIG